MSDDNECLPHLSPKVKEKLMQLRLILRIKTARRLVGKYHLRAIHKGTGHSYTLFLAARELGRLMGGTIDKSQKIEHLHCAASGISHACASNKRRHHHILNSRKFGQQLMKLKHKTDVAIAESRELLLIIYRHINSIEQYSSAIGTVERTDDLQQRSLARSAGTNYTDYLSLIDSKINTFKHL